MRFDNRVRTNNGPPVTQNLSKAVREEQAGNDVISGK